ncbi:creatininase [Halobacteriales archaeon SW_7_68_16]|nr:MAG: creatininase [Halobacteriales archaeon SW_7_68_16]
MELTTATWTDVRDADARVGLVPVGATENHGPHAPLGTDVVAAEAVAATVADREGIVLAPPIHVGISEEHRAFDGTLWVSPDAFRAYVGDVGRSLAAWVDAVVFVNGHGGNVAALHEVAARLARDDACHAVPFTWFEAVDAGPSMGHAGPRETALLRAVGPELVREDRVEAADENAANRWGEWAGNTNLAHDSDEFAPNGVVGDPTAGDATLGNRLLEEAETALDDLLDAVERRLDDRDTDADDDPT